MPKITLKPWYEGEQVFIIAASGQEARYACELMQLPLKHCRYVSVADYLRRGDDLYGDRARSFIRTSRVAGHPTGYAAFS